MRGEKYGARRMGDARMEDDDRNDRTRERTTYCCWRLSWREQRVSQPGKGHLWLRSPVCILVCLAR